MKILPEKARPKHRGILELNFLPVRKAIIFMRLHFSNSGLKDICQTEARNMNIIILIVLGGAMFPSYSLHLCILAIHASSLR